MPAHAAQLPKGLKYWQNYVLGFSGFFDVPAKTLSATKLDGANQIRRAKEMTGREAFDFIQRGRALHQQAIELAIGKLNKEQVMVLLANKPPQEISIPLQVRLRELEREQRRA